MAALLDLEADIAGYEGTYKWVPLFSPHQSKSGLAPAESG